MSGYGNGADYDDELDGDDAGLVRDLHAQLKAEQAKVKARDEELANYRGPSRPTDPGAIADVSQRVNTAGTRDELDDALRLAGFTISREGEGYRSWRR